MAIPFGASHPEGFATYAFRMTRGTATVPLSQPASGPVSGITPATDPITETVAALFAPSGCTIAGFAAWVYVWAKALTGWSRCSQYDAQAVEAFVLAL